MDRISFTSQLRSIIFIIIIYGSISVERTVNERVFASLIVYVVIYTYVRDRSLRVRVMMTLKPEIYRFFLSTSITTMIFAYHGTLFKEDPVSQSFLTYERNVTSHKPS